MSEVMAFSECFKIVSLWKLSIMGSFSRSGRTESYEYVSKTTSGNNLVCEETQNLNERL